MNQSVFHKIGGDKPVPPISLRGNSMAVLHFLIMLADTKPLPNDKVFWQIEIAKMNWN